MIRVFKEDKYFLRDKFREFNERTLNVELTDQDISDMLSLSLVRPSVRRHFYKNLLNKIMSSNTNITEGDALDLLCISIENGMDLIEMNHNVNPYTLL